MDFKNCGLYLVSDQYFSDYPNIRHMSKKHEGRPYYLAVKGDNGILWLIPLSTKVEKYSAKIAADEKKYGECLFYYIAKVKGRDNAFLIGNVIPASEQYIKKPFTVLGKPFVIEDKKDIKKIRSKLSRYLTLVRRGMMKPAVDILEIERKLLEQNS